MLKVHANLMRAPRMQPHLDKRRAVQALDNTILSAGFTASNITGHRHPFSVVWMARNVRANLAAGTWNFPAYDCEINLFHCAAGELLLKPQMREIVFCRYEAPARIDIEPVNARAIPFRRLEQEARQLGVAGPLTSP